MKMTFSFFKEGSPKAALDDRRYFDFPPPDLPLTAAARVARAANEVLLTGPLPERAVADWMAEARVWVIGVLWDDLFMVWVVWILQLMLEPLFSFRAPH